MKYGIDETRASTLISVISIANMFGRIICGFLMDRTWVNAIKFYNISFLCSAISTVSFLACSSYISFVICSLFYGLVIANYVSQASVLLADLFGLDGLSSTFGLLSLCKGVATVISSPLGGVLYELTQTYVTPFCTGAGLFIGCFVFGVTAEYLHQRKYNDKENKV